MQQGEKTNDETLKKMVAHLLCHWVSWNYYLYESYQVLDHWGIHYYHLVGCVGWLDPAFP